MVGGTFDALSVASRGASVDLTSSDVRRFVVNFFAFVIAGVDFCMDGVELSVSVFEVAVDFLGNR
jgi:hypothetical protein